MHVVRCTVYGEFRDSDRARYCTMHHAPNPVNNDAHAQCTSRCSLLILMKNTHSFIGVAKFNTNKLLYIRRHVKLGLLFYGSQFSKLTVF